MNPISWKNWISFFEAKSFKCYAPAYPFHDGNPSALRNTINSNLGKTTFGQVIDSLSGFIDTLPERPILIGHSMGDGRNIPRSSTKNDGKIDFRKPHNPLLMIAGEKDHIIPSSLNKKNFEAYEDKKSKIDFKEFAGRTHYICGQQNWEEVASYSNDWITNLNKKNDK